MQVNGINPKTNFKGAYVKFATDWRDMKDYQVLSPRIVHGIFERAQEKIGMVVVLRTQEALHKLGTYVGDSFANTFGDMLVALTGKDAKKFGGIKDLESRRQFLKELLGEDKHLSDAVIVPIEPEHFKCRII